MQTINGISVAQAAAESIAVRALTDKVAALMEENRYLRSQLNLVNEKLDRTRKVELENYHRMSHRSRTAFQLAHPVISWFVEPIGDNL